MHPIVLMLLQKLDFNEVSADYEGGTSKKRKSASPQKPAVKTKKTRIARRAPSDDEQGSDPERDSLAYDALPDWVKPEVKTVVVPSIVEYIACQQDPWSLDTEAYTFQELVQKLLNRVFPQRHHTVEKRDIIYKWVCSMYITSG